MSLNIEGGGGGGGGEKGPSLPFPTGHRDERDFSSRLQSRKKRKASSIHLTKKRKKRREPVTWTIQSTLPIQAKSLGEEKKQARYLS